MKIEVRKIDLDTLHTVIYRDTFDSVDEQVFMDLNKILVLLNKFNNDNTYDDMNNLLDSTIYNCSNMLKWKFEKLTTTECESIKNIIENIFKLFISANEYDVLTSKRTINELMLLGKIFNISACPVTNKLTDLTTLIERILLLINYFRMKKVEVYREQQRGE